LNILFLTQVLPYPLVGGAKIRAYYLLRQLAKSHLVTLVSFVRDDDRPEHVAHLLTFCQAVHTVPMARSWVKNVRSLAESVLTGRPLVVVRDRLPAMQALLKRLVREGSFDVIHADQTAMAQYAHFAQAAQQATSFRPRLILDQHNALHLVVRRQAGFEKGPVRVLWKREAGRLATYEADLCRQFDHILTVTEEDRIALLGLLPEEEAATLSERFAVLPICVDPAGQLPLAQKGDRPQIIFLGTMFWPPNVEGVLWFAREVMPLILARVPETHFVVAGKDPPPAVQALAADGSPLTGRIEVTGFLSDARPLLSSSQVFVVPLLAGGGMRVKIVDAWMWGLPVVSTTIGAEGIETRPGENILLADEPVAFADAVVRILTDPALGKKLSVNGRQWLETHYDWRTVYPQIDEIYSQFAQH
jgi:polysaccharide biosynthesis protein PslH